MITVLVMVLWMEAASSGRFLPRFSEANLVRAVGSASAVKRQKVVAMKSRMDRIPMSVWVRAPVLVTII